MKKSVLALSVSAAIGGMGFAGGALAMTDALTAGVQTATGQSLGLTATELAYNADGIGHQLVFPYFTTQGDNATLISLVNTDTTNGKLVKVRFRGAGNSDDLYDFQIALSPGDVWTAAVSQDATTGASKLTTSDVSCTLPASVNSTFGTGRVDPSKDAANETREGYVEVLNMADIPPTTGTTTGVDSLYEAIKHVSGVAPCTASILEAKLGVDHSYGSAVAAGLASPTTGLVGDWIILNQANTAAWSGSATALQADGAGALVFWPQKFGDPVQDGTAAARIAATADPLFLSGAEDLQFYDLPDLSTPYTTADTSAALRANATTASLAVNSVKNQFVTSDSIAAVTDWLFSQPTRRYHMAVNYRGIPEDNATVTTELNPFATTGSTAFALVRATATEVVTAVTNSDTTAINAYYDGRNTRLADRQVCLDTLSVPARNSLFDREETTPGTSQSPFVISPNVPGTPTTLLLCGEANVISVNAGDAADSALGASVAARDITFDAAYTDGWASWATAGNGAGLPILGAAFIRAANGAVNYGFAYQHKVTRPVAP